jgi:hypothetical protein
MSDTRISHASILARTVTAVTLLTGVGSVLYLTCTGQQQSAIRSVRLAREIARTDSNINQYVLVLTQEDGQRIACPVDLDPRSGTVITSPTSRDCYGVEKGQLTAIPRQAWFRIEGLSRLSIGQGATVSIKSESSKTTSVQVQIDGLIGAGASSRVDGSLQVQELFDFRE